MTPIICDYSGKVVLTRHGTKTPELNRDYFVFHDKVVSAESKEALERILRKNLESSGFGKYKFKDYQSLLIELAQKHCGKGKSSEDTMMKQLGAQ